MPPLYTLDLQNPNVLRKHRVPSYLPQGRCPPTPCSSPVAKRLRGKKRKKVASKEEKAAMKVLQKEVPKRLLVPPPLQLDSASFPAPLSPISLPPPLSPLPFKDTPSIFMDEDGKRLLEALGW